MYSTCKTFWAGVISIKDLQKNAAQVGISLLPSDFACSSVGVHPLRMPMLILYRHFQSIDVTSYNKSTRYAYCKTSCCSISVLVLLLSWSVLSLPYSQLPAHARALNHRALFSLSLFFYRILSSSIRLSISSACHLFLFHNGLLSYYTLKDNIS